MYKYKKLPFLFLVILLIACSRPPSEADIQIAIELTQTAVPSPTSTLQPEPTATVPMSEVDIATYVTEGLPSHISGTVLSTEQLPKNHKLGDVEFGKFIVNQRFHNEKTDSYGGIVIVSAWDNTKDARDLYLRLQEIVKPSPLPTFEPNVGEESVGGVDFSIAFRTCGVVVFVAMAATKDQIVAYAQNLEHNLAQELCPYLTDQ